MQNSVAETKIHPVKLAQLC